MGGGGWSFALSPALGAGWGRGGVCVFPYLKDVTVTTLLFYKHLLKAWKTQLSVRCVYFMM